MSCAGRGGGWIDARARERARANSPRAHPPHTPSASASRRGALGERAAGGAGRERGPFAGGRGAMEAFVDGMGGAGGGLLGEGGEDDSLMQVLVRQILNGLMLAAAVSMLMRAWREQRAAARAAAVGGAAGAGPAEAFEQEQIDAFAAAAVQAQAFGEAQAHAVRAAAAKATAKRGAAPRAPSALYTAATQPSSRGGAGDAAAARSTTGAPAGVPAAEKASLGVPSLPRRRAPSARRRAAARAAVGTTPTNPPPAPLNARPLARAISCRPQRAFTALTSIGFAEAWHSSANSTGLQVGAWCRGTPKDISLRALYTGASATPIRWRRVRFTHAPNRLLMRGACDAIELQMVVHEDPAAGTGVVEVCQVNDNGKSSPRLVIWQQIAVSPEEAGNPEGAAAASVSWRVEWVRPPPRLLRGFANRALDKLLRTFTGRYLVSLEDHALAGAPSAPLSRQGSRASIASTAMSDAGVPARRRRGPLRRLVGVVFKVALLAGVGVGAHKFVKAHPLRHHNLLMTNAEKEAERAQGRAQRAKRRKEAQGGAHAKQEGPGRARETQQQPQQQQEQEQQEQEQEQEQRQKQGDAQETVVLTEHGGGTGAVQERDGPVPVPAPVVAERWSAAVDPSTGRTYYFNASGKTQWEPPAGWAQN